MKLIVGLGNPGVQYDRTRHNFGFMIIDQLADQLAAGQSWKKDAKFRAQILAVDYAGERVVLVKPETFYNLTGEAVRRIMDYYHIATTDVLAIHDEMALPLGTVRSRLGGSDAGNNGIKSMNQHCGEGYYRLRVGSGSLTPTLASRRDQVLNRLNQADQEAFDSVASQVVNLAREFIVGNLTQTTYRFIDKNQ